MEEADSPHPSFLKRLRQMFSRRIITQPEDLEREIQHIIDEGEERGLITRQEGQLIESIFEFRDTLVREIMVPRLEMVGVERYTPLDQIIALVLSCGHSRLPVFDGDIDHIKGILLAKDLLVFWQNPDTTWDPERVLRPAYFIPESKKISDLLRDLVERKTQIAVVIDEYGGTAGLITLEDILEEIVGEIYDEYDRHGAPPRPPGRRLRPGGRPPGRGRIDGPLHSAPAGRQVRIRGGPPDPLPGPGAPDQRPGGDPEPGVDRAVRRRTPGQTGPGPPAAPGRRGRGLGVRKSPNCPANRNSPSPFPPPIFDHHIISFIFKGPTIIVDYGKILPAPIHRGFHINLIV